MFNAEFLYFDCPGANHAHCASIIAGPNNSLIAAWYVYPSEESKEAKLVIARKEGPQSNWTNAKPIDLGMSSSLGNPTLFIDPSGRLWLHFVALKGGYWTTAQWHVAYSDDLGLTFSRANVLSMKEGLMVRHRPLMLNSGKAIIPIYDEKTMTSSVYESEAPFDQWQENFAFGDDPIIQADIVLLNDTLCMFFRPSDEPRNTWRSISSDEGKNWGSPVRLSLPNPLSGIAAVTQGDRVGLVYNDTTEHQRYPISISWSDASLHEWSEPIAFDNPGFEVSYPSFTVDDQNIVHGVYTYNRKFIKYVCFDEDWSRGHGA